MHRIDTSTALKDKFGSGKNGYTDGDPSTGRQATDLDADMFDELQEEICAPIEAAGITLQKGVRNQLLTALKKLFLAGDDSRVSGALQKAKNLSDVADAATAKKNLSLNKVGNWAAVQQGGGTDMKDNKVYVGWSGDYPIMQVDTTKLGKIFCELFPPTAVQCGAYPQAGGNVGGYVNATFFSAAQACNPAQQVQGTFVGWNGSGNQGESNFVNNRGGGIGGFTFTTVNSSNTVQTGAVTIDGGGTLNTATGTLNEMGQRVYSPNNPPPIASSAVTGFRFASSTWVTTGSSDWSAPSGTCVTGVGIYTGAKARYSYAQILINGQWLNVETVS